MTTTKTPASSAAPLPDAKPDAARDAMPQTLRLGGLTLSGPFLLAPLEGVSDVGFRRLCWQQGAGLVFTEMIRARGIAKRNRSTLDLIDTWEDDVPTGLQLMTTGPQELADALGTLDALALELPRLKNIRSVDLNFGCPSPDVIRVGAGPAMLKRRGRLENIYRVLADWKKSTSLPIAAVSTKIRLGLNAREQEHKVYLPVVEAASQHLDWITVHARHAGQRSRDVPTWSAIGECKRISTIPVIGNGDVRTRADALRMREQTGCDGFLIARAAIANPWCFGELRGQSTGTPTPADVDAAARAYADTARTHGTKDKYRQFHADNFARLSSIAGGGRAEFRIPKNAHLG